MAGPAAAAGKASIAAPAFVSGPWLAAFPTGPASSPHRETTMLQNMSAHRRPSRATVLFWVILTLAWWTGLCLYAGRPIWFW